MARPRKLDPEETPTLVEDVIPGERAEIVEFVSFEAVAGFMRSNLIVFAVSMVLSIFMGLVWIATTDRMYEATVKLSASTGSGGIQGNAIKTTASILQNFTLAGGSITGRFSIFREKLFSVDVAHKMAFEQGYLKRIFSGQWDASHQEWVPPDRLLASFKRFVRRSLNLPDWRPPTHLGLLKYLEGEVEAIHDAASDIVELTYRHSDPEFALKLLSDLVATTDLVIRLDERIRSESYISYLQERLEATANAETRIALANVLVSEERKIALSYSDLPFAADYLDKPSVSDMPVSPTLVKSLFIAGIIGIILGFMAGFARTLLPGRKPDYAEFE